MEWFLLIVICVLLFILLLLGFLILVSVLRLICQFFLWVTDPIFYPPTRYEVRS